MTMKPRSACTKILNRLLSTCGKTSSSASARPRLCMISIIAASFTSGLAETLIPRLERRNLQLRHDRRAARLAVVVGDERAQARAVEHCDRPAGAVGCGGCAGRAASLPNVKLTSQTRITSPGLSVPPAVDFLRLFVQKRAVAAAEILELVIVALANDLAVIAADGPDLDHDVAVGMPAENPLVPFQLVLAASLGTVVRHQIKHGR